MPQPLPLPLQNKVGKLKHRWKCQAPRRVVVATLSPCSNTEGAADDEEKAEMQFKAAGPIVIKMRQKSNFTSFYFSLFTYQDSTGLLPSITLAFG